MHRANCVAAAVLTTAFLSGPAAAQTTAQSEAEQLARYCADPHPEVRLLACKLIIDKGTGDAAAMASAYTSRGTAYSITGDPDHAIEDFDHAIEIDPNRTLVFSFRGAAYLDKKDYDHAITDYTRSVELDAKHTDAFYGRASAYR